MNTGNADESPHNNKVNSSKKNDVKQQTYFCKMHNKNIQTFVCGVWSQIYEMPELSIL